MTTMTVPAPGPARWARLADRLFLWVPNARRPGIGAFLLGLLRECTLPFVLMSLLLLGLAPFSRQLSPPNPIGVAIGLGSFVLFEELARYAFVRRAEKRVRAIAIFTVATILVECVTYYNPHLSPLHNLIRRAPSWLVHISAGVALYWALTDRRRVLAVVSGLIVLHTAFDVGTVQFFGAQMQAEDIHAAKSNVRGQHVDPIVKVVR